MKMNRNVYKAFMYFFIYAAVALTLAVACFIVGFVLIKGLPFVSWRLLSTKPSYINQTIGILPDIKSTCFMLVFTLVIVLPVGVGAAIYLTEYCSNKKLVALIQFASEILSGIPSVIYGLVGMLCFCQSLKLGTSLAAGGLTLAVMTLPVVLCTTQESLKAVPLSYRYGAFALGAGKWRTIYTVVLPACKEGIITGAILSAGRIIGESAALLFTAGFAHKTLTVALYFYAKEQGEFEAAFAIAAILMVLTLAINLAATIFNKRKIK